MSLGIGSKVIITTNAGRMKGWKGEIIREGLVGSDAVTRRPIYWDYAVKTKYGGVFGFNEDELKEV
jgi:hypothetical protein